MNRDTVSGRLPLRPVEVDNLRALHSLWTDERVRRFLWDGAVIPLESTPEIIEKSCALFEECDFGIWAVHERGSDELVRFARYWHFRVPPSREPLFGVASGHWNRGFATESCQCVIRYGFEELGFHSVGASADVGNAAAVRALAWLGMLFRRRDRGEGLDTVFYKLNRDDWG